MSKIYYYLVGLLLVISLTQPVFSENTPYQQQLIRVGISNNNFKYLEHKSTRFTATSSFNIKDLSKNQVLIKASPGAVYTVTVSSKGFNIWSGKKFILSNIVGPIGVSSPSGIIKLLDVKRKGKTAGFRGSIEIVRASSSPSKLCVVNVLPMVEYLKGVVPNELPVSFGFEALKAQAVAARNYAVRPREKPYPQFDICDSVMCQVYFGYYTEKPLSTKAVRETEGLVALYNGEVITTLYSSAAGGFTESYENAFSDPKTKAFPPEPKPYLKGKSDTGQHKDLSSEAAARKFYTTSPPGFDVKSSYYRWAREWTRSELENAINYNLAKLSKTKGSKPFIKPAFNSGSSIGVLKNIQALKRGVSGKIVELEITGTNGKWTVQKELNIRRLLTKNGKALPSANIVFSRYTDGSGNITAVKVNGGGFGHGVGMSQYGASYMSSKGYNFARILQHYYSNIALGTIPVILYAQSFAEPVKKTFYSPDGTAVLKLENEGVSPLKININGKDLLISEESDVTVGRAIDITPYVSKGFNNVIFYPPEAEECEGLSVKMWIEVVKAR